MSRQAVILHVLDLLRGIMVILGLGLTIVFLMIVHFFYDTLRLPLLLIFFALLAVCFGVTLYCIKKQLDELKKT